MERLDPFSLASRDVYSYLKELKKLGHRGQTSRELILKFWGVISERTVLSNLARLKKAKYIRARKIKYNSKIYVTFYEAI